MRRSAHCGLAAALCVVALGLGTLFAVGIPAAGATMANDDASFRTAFANTSETHIDLTADITMSCGSLTFTRESATAITIDGHGHIITATGCNAQVIANFGPGALTLTHVTITGGNPIGTNVGGGGVRSDADTVLDHARVTGNTHTATSSTATATGGGIEVLGSGILTVIHSTIDGNTATCSSTCSGASGGGISAGPLVMRNSTVTGNVASNPANPSAASGGGLFLQGDEPTTLLYSTIADNTAALGANVVGGAAVPGTAFGSVIANPLGGGFNCSGSGWTSAGYNYEESAPTGSCAFNHVNDTVSTTDPQLGALAANDGPTPTRLPAMASALVDAIPPASCQTDGATGIVTDQRDLVRAETAAGDCDIGAVERENLEANGTFTATTPTRILDTRKNVGLNGAFAAQQTRDLLVAGAGPVLASGVEAVLMNVTATGATKAGWLTLFPAGTTLPTASNLNFSAGQTVPNLVVVRLGHGTGNEGEISIGNTVGGANAGSVHVVADVVGYYRDGTLSDDTIFTGITPDRILDTRSNLGLSGAFQPHATRDLEVAGFGDVPDEADSVVINVTATAATHSGWLTVFPAGTTLPTASNLNFSAGQTVPNLVTVKLGTGGNDNEVSINNTGTTAAAGTVHVVADVVGYYQGASGNTLIPTPPQRIVDTRNGTGGVTGPIAPQATITVDPRTAIGLPPAGSYDALIVNVTATAPTKAGWLTVYPSNDTLPTASNLNFVAGQTVPNLVKVKVGTDGKIKITNTGGCACAGTVQIVVDLVGFYV